MNLGKQKEGNENPHTKPGYGGGTHPEIFRKAHYVASKRRSAARIAAKLVRLRGWQCSE